MAAQGLSFKRLPYYVSSGIAVVFFLLNLLGWIDFHELDSVDLRFRLRGKAPAHPKIVLVEIDDPSVAVVGQWPWNRDVHALMLDVIRGYRPQLVFFDILFTEKSPIEANDREFARALAESGNVVLSFFYYSQKPFKAFFPLEIFRQAALDIGYANMGPDHDGVIRKFAALVDYEKGVYYHPAVLARLLFTPNAQEREAWLRTLPLNRSGMMWINYPGDIHSFHRIPFWKLVEAAGGAGDAELQRAIEDSIVIVGQTATGTTDLRSTPFGPNQPGILIQASALQTILTGKYLRQIPWAINLLILLFVSFLTTRLTRRLTPFRALLMAMGLAISYGIFTVLLFCFQGLILLFFIPMMIIVIAYIVALLSKYVEVRFQGELIHRELKMAANIQENFLPPQPPEHAQLDLAFGIRFAKEVGGDLYDWLWLGPDRLGLCIGDVSGKGVPAALYMAKVISEFRTHAKNFQDPGQMVHALNRQLCASGIPAMFVTFLYGVFDIPTRQFSFASAGHEPMIFYRAQERKAVLIREPQGSPAGLFEEMTFDTGKIDYAKGDLIVAVTDGVKEQRNSQGQEFGLERLRDVVEKLAQKTPKAQDLIAELFGVMTSYQKDMPPHDDRTVLCVRFQ
ncbi:MAG: CHASE2 domain-containing protein [Candidatus Omnitrophota bacterium]